MGYLLDVITGKIGLQNVLLANNVEKITKRIKSYPKTSFTNIWATYCVFTIFSFLMEMFFKDKSEFTKYLRMNVRRLDEQIAFEIFKLLGGFHLAIFLYNENTDDHLKDLGVNKDSFIKDIFSIFDYSSKDINHYKSFYTKDFAPSSMEIYCIKIYEQIIKLIDVPEPKNIYSDSQYFGRLLADQHIHVFLKALQNRLSQLDQKIS